MTSPFRSTAGAPKGDKEEFIGLYTPGVANEVGIFFINWRIEHWPTATTQSGKQAEVIGVDFVNLTTGQVFPNIHVRQVYVIIPLKAAGIGEMAIGRVKYTERTRSDPPKYEWEDFSEHAGAVSAGIGWLGNNPGFVRSEKPNYDPNRNRNQAQEQEPQSAPPAQNGFGNNTWAPGTQLLGGGQVPAPGAPQSAFNQYVNDFNQGRGQTQPNQNVATTAPMNASTAPAAPSPEPTFGNFTAPSQPQTLDEQRQFGNQNQDPPSAAW